MGVDPFPELLDQGKTSVAEALRIGAEFVERVETCIQGVSGSSMGARSGDNSGEGTH